ncbi:Olfactory receptor 7A10 [Sciurus carolinensis]|uniref:Olfactory receptor n=1 Tax=Sciurus carolinensis TaxID=30640 RepID=A0AA41SV13_SCICA|nr:Olfactory receptor 7A10 [Sciurus carolinensis]
MLYPDGPELDSRSTTPSPGEHLRLQGCSAAQLGGWWVGRVSAFLICGVPALLMASSGHSPPSSPSFQGFQDSRQDPELQPLIVGLFLSMYLVTVLGNLLIILAIISDSHLHTPMYFFLSNLSFVDICFTSTTIPKMLVNIQTQSKAITYAGCLTQIHFFVLLIELDILLLTVMAYDRYVAICRPLHYMVIMKPHLCGLLILVSWVVSVLYAFLQSLLVLCLSFCMDLEIPHFCCELNQVVQLACSDTFLNEVVIYVAAILLGGGPLTGILYSYSKIVSSICAISSAQGRYKAFSTCASHLSVVSLFYCTRPGMYLSSAVTQNSRSTSTAYVMYTVVTPCCTPSSTV